MNISFFNVVIGTLKTRILSIRFMAEYQNVQRTVFSKKSGISKYLNKGLNNVKEY